MDQLNAVVDIVILDNCHSYINIDEKALFSYFNYRSFLKLHFIKNIFKVKPLFKKKETLKFFKYGL